MGQGRGSPSTADRQGRFEVDVEVEFDLDVHVLASSDQGLDDRRTVWPRSRIRAPHRRATERAEGTRARSRVVAWRASVLRSGPAPAGGRLGDNRHRLDDDDVVDSSPSLAARQHVHALLSWSVEMLPTLIPDSASAPRRRRLGGRDDTPTTTVCHPRCLTPPRRPCRQLFLPHPPECRVESSLTDRLGSASAPARCGKQQVRQLHHAPRHPVSDRQLVPVDSAFPREVGDDRVPAIGTTRSCCLGDVADERHVAGAGATRDHAQFHRCQVLGLVDDHVPIRRDGALKSARASSISARSARLKGVRRRPSRRGAPAPGLRSRGAHLPRRGEGAARSSAGRGLRPRPPRSARCARECSTIHGRP